MNPKFIAQAGRSEAGVARHGLITLAFSSESGTIWRENRPRRSRAARSISSAIVLARSISGP